MLSRAEGRVGRRRFLTGVAAAAAALAPGDRMARAAPQRGRLRVIDVHQHVRLMRGSLGETLASPETELNMRLESMERDGIDQAIIIPGHVSSLGPISILTRYRRSGPCPAGNPGRGSQRCGTKADLIRHYHEAAADFLRLAAPPWLDASKPRGRRALLDAPAAAYR